MMYSYAIIIKVQLPYLQDVILVDSCFLRFRGSLCTYFQVKTRFDRSGSSHAKKQSQIRTQDVKRNRIDMYLFYFYHFLGKTK